MNKYNQTNHLDKSVNRLGSIWIFFFNARRNKKE